LEENFGFVWLEKRVEGGKLRRENGGVYFFLGPQFFFSTNQKENIARNFP